MIGPTPVRHASYETYFSSLVHLAESSSNRSRDVLVGTTPANAP